MPSFLTYAGTGELLSLAMRGTLTTGQTCNGFDLLLVKDETVVWRSSETVGSIAYDLTPGTAYTTGFLTRTAGTWTVGPAPGPLPVVAGTIASPLTLTTAAAFGFKGCALALGTSPSSTLLAYIELPPLNVSPRQTVTIAGGSVGLGPLQSGSASLTSHGAEVVLHLALNGAIPGGPPSAFGVGMVSSSFTPPPHPGGWDLTRADLEAHLLPPTVFDRTLELPRSAAAWAVTVGDEDEPAVVKPSQRLSFAYVGTSTIEVASMVTFDGPAETGSPILLVPFTTTHELSATARTVEVTFP